MQIKTAWITIILLGLYLNILAQPSAKESTTLRPGLPDQKIETALDSFNRKLTPEKLFLHTDKTNYTTEDTIWIKGYLLNGINHKYSTISGLVYVEVISDSLKIVKSISMPVAIGLLWGQIALDAESYPEGFYTIRAYTNWMQNFGDQYFFKKRIYIARASDEHWLIKKQQQVMYSAEKQTLNFGLQITDFNKKNYGLKELKWKVTENDKTLVKGNSQTKVDGSIQDEFIIPEKRKGVLKLVIEENSKSGQRAVIPLILNRPENTDVQFMPEGGHLVANLPAKLAFKALGEDGLGVNISGKIMDSQNKEIMEFHSDYKGMGTLDFIPLAGQTYKAKVNLPDGKTKTFALPNVKVSGTVLQVNTPFNNNFLKVSVRLTEDLLSSRPFTLLGLVNGKCYCSERFTPKNKNVVYMLDKRNFPAGIVHFLLFNENNQPLNERLSFIDQQDRLSIEIGTPKTTYSLKDSIPLALKISNKRGEPIAGSFSLAVTDDTQVPVDSLADNIFSNVFLSAELKGSIESPGYYFMNTPESAGALDLLLLTQGWVAYNWDEILKPVGKPPFLAQPEFNVSGTVTNLTNKPVAAANMLLTSSSKFHIMKDTVTNKDGRFTFRNFPPVDTISFFIQARNKRGGTLGLAVEVDKFKSAPVKGYSGISVMPWYVSTDTTLLHLIKSKNEQKTQLAKITGTSMLNEVVVKAKKVIKNSKNLNGPGEADQVIDEAEIAKAVEFKLTNYLLQNVKKLRIGKIPGKDDQKFFIENEGVRFIIDGVDLDRFYEGSAPYEYYEYITTHLNLIEKDDLLGIEVISSSKNVIRYDMSFIRSNEPNPPVVYIEITTRSGNGVFSKSVAGMALYRPMPLTAPKQFYRPRYTPANINDKTADFRSTIHWQPHLYTDTSGSGFTSFYAAEKPGTYTVIVQGSNMNGLFGYKTFKLNIGNSPK